MRHTMLTASAALITSLTYHEIPSPDVHHRLSMSSAYAAMSFLAVSLCIGPWHILRRKPNPVSFDLRRHIGVWAGLLAVFHTCIGLTVHLRGRMWMYFFRRLHPLALQKTEFGFANYTGLVAALLFLMLLAISNNVSMRTLGTKDWKLLQRWVYVAFGLTVLHGISYQLVEKRRLPWVIIFAALGMAAIAFQTLGFIRIRKSARVSRGRVPQ
jgi:sulfoxide reductase heme-binding subunit YedZ